MTRRIVRCVSVRRGCTLHDWCLRHWSNDHWLLAPMSPEHSTEPSPVAVSSHHNTPGHLTLYCGPTYSSVNTFACQCCQVSPAPPLLRGAAGALSLTGAGLSTVATLYCLNRRDFGVSAAALAPAVIGGTGHSLVTVAWQIPEVARFPMAGGGSV